MRTGALAFVLTTSFVHACGIDLADGTSMTTDSDGQAEGPDTDDSLDPGDDPGDPKDDGHGHSSGETDGGATDGGTAGDDQEDEDTEAGEDTEGDDPAVGSACLEHRTALLAGKFHEAGWVTVELFDDELVIQLVATKPWSIGLVHVYAGAGPVPANGGGYIPGKFPWHVTPEAGSTRVDLSIDIDELQVGCGDPLVLAVHAETSDGERLETAWAEGRLTAGASWGMAFALPRCCSTVPL